MQPVPDAPLVWEDRSAIAPHLRDLALDEARVSDGYFASKVRKACGTFYALVLGERLLVCRRSHIDALLAVAYAATEPGPTWVW